MQVVDPFIPVTKQRQRPLAKKRPPSRTPQSVDGFMPGPQVMRQRPKPLVSPPKVRPRPTPIQTPVVPHTYTPPRPAPPSDAFARAERQMTAQPTRRSGFRRFRTLLLQSFVFMALFGVGFILRSLLVGEIIIVLYGIFAFAFRIESRTTFAFVLISFVVILIASLRSDTALASVFAVYAFLLLVVGTISLGREVHNEI